MGEDLNLLAVLPDGKLCIDVLTGTATYSSTANLELCVVGELQSWLLNRLSEVRIDVTAIRSAMLTAVIGTDRIATNRKQINSFNFAVESKVETSDRVYRGALHKVRKWQKRTPSNETIQPTCEEALGRWLEILCKR